MVSIETGIVFARRYRILRLIATGGMGAVYEVLHLSTERRRALKVMHPHVLASEALRERFKREARIAARVESEYIVDVFDAGVDEPTGTPFLVMELLRGEDLGARLARLGRLPKEEVATYLHQTALALDKTHRAHIVHRDLKPRNLFLTEREDGPPRIKVLDFGIAKIAAEGASTCGTQAVGTPAYMAPEQLDPEARLTGATDVYALGMAAYTLLVGAPYFDEEAKARGVLALAAVIARGPRDAASKRAAARGATLPEAFDAWFARATAMRPEARFPSAIEAARALAEALGVHDTTPEATPPATPIGLSTTLSRSLGARASRIAIAMRRRFEVRASRAEKVAAAVLGLGATFALGWQIGTDNATGNGARAVDVRPLATAAAVPSTDDLSESLDRGACPSGAACGGQCVDTSADAENCGACGHSCLGGTCEAGSCQPVILASGQRAPIDVAVDGQLVYWINLGVGEHDGAVLAAPIGGGSAVTLAARQSRPSGMTVAAGHVYWVNYGNGTVMRAPVHGGAPEVLRAGQRGPRSVAVSADRVYWTNRNDGTVRLLDEGGESTLASAQTQPGALALDAENVYWAERGGRRLMAISMRGGAPRSLAYGPETPIGIAVDAKRVYWVEYDGGRVMSVLLKGGRSTVLASGQRHPLAIAVDGERVYWTNQDEGTVMSVPLEGGSATRLCSGQAWPVSLSLDDVSLYWTNEKGGQVMRLAK
ncbi:Putative serine/threonine-protein kinase pknH [Minicystis rosea]|nr:Putative serine/threonine-protein kinase pknH [Minicystis rosea]